MSTVAELEQHIENLQAVVERRNMAQALYQNREFKKLIVEDYFTTECARYAQLSADPALKPEQRADALAMAQAAGHLKRFLSVCIQMGNRAEVEIDQTREELEVVRTEEN